MAGSDEVRFGTLRRSRRIWAIGGVHGEAAQLSALHEQLAGRFTFGDRFVYLGNVLGVGPDVGGAIDELLAFRRQILAVPGAHVCDMVFLRGAQEEMWHKLLQIQLAINPAEVLGWMRTQGVGATLQAYGGTFDEALSRARGGARDLARWTNELRDAIARRPGHREYMSALKRAALTDDGALLFVHAGIDPNLPLDAQRDAFWWGASGFDSLEKPYGEFRKVIRGWAEAHPGVEVAEYRATVDGGTGSGAPLIAACFAANGDLVDQVEA